MGKTKAGTWLLVNRSQARNRTFLGPYLLSFYSISICQISLTDEPIAKVIFIEIASSLYSS